MSIDKKTIKRGNGKGHQKWMNLHFTARAKSNPGRSRLVDALPMRVSQLMILCKSCFGVSAQKDSRTTIPLLTVFADSATQKTQTKSCIELFTIFLLALIPWSETINVKRALVGLHQDQEACSTLENHEVYSSVKVAIGNPPQLFDLVADTGSDNCIVNDCSCKQCPQAWGSCFTGPHHSNSFKLPLFKVESENGDPSVEAPAAMVMRFGSGDISAEIASDQIEVGPFKVYMENGLLLMVDHALKLTGHFEGILGLGRPQERFQDPASTATAVHVPGFLDRAKVRRFSMCLNHKAPGVLGFNTPIHQNPLSSAGQAHWSLNFHGATLGHENPYVDIGCAEGAKCSIIPDSGTTLIVGPEAAIFNLYDDLCMRWERCNQMYKKLKEEMYKQADLLESPPSGFMETVAKLAASSGEYLSGKSMNSSALLKTDTSRRGSTLMASESSAGASNESFDFDVSPTMALQLLLEHCFDWMEGVDINAEMPDLVFHVSDKHGKKQGLTISPRSYILAKTVDVEVPGFRKISDIHLNTKHTERKQVCVMAFSPGNYQTEVDGQIWILGMPLFYEYTAHYDRGETPEQVTMGFTPRDEQECGKCDGNVITRAESLIDAQMDENDGNEASLGVKSLNSLSKQPIIRDFSKVKQL